MQDQYRFSYQISRDAVRFGIDPSRIRRVLRMKYECVNGRFQCNKLYAIETRTH